MKRLHPPSPPILMLTWSAVLLPPVLTIVTPSQVFTCAPTDPELRCTPHYPKLLFPSQSLPSSKCFTGFRFTRGSTSESCFTPLRPSPLYISLNSSISLLQPAPFDPPPPFIWLHPLLVFSITGSKAFSRSAPQLWSPLPPDLHNLDSHDI